MAVILHLPVRLIILTNKTDKYFPSFIQIPIDKYTHPSKKLVTPPYALSICHTTPDQRKFSTEFGKNMRIPRIFYILLYLHIGSQG